MSRAEELAAFLGFIVAVAAVLLTQYGTEAVLVYVLFAIWRVQVHNRKKNSYPPGMRGDPDDPPGMTDSEHNDPRER